MILNLRFIFWHSAKTLLIGGLLSTTFGLTQSPATASGIQKLADFSYADGRYPFSGLTWGGDGLFYGTTSSGGSFGLNGAGTIFSFNPANNALTKLADFDGFNGARSEASLTLGSDGLFYGTASGGGSLGGDFGRGTIFSFDPTSNALTKLAEFDDSNGALPSASLTLSPDGLFYGTTSGGGSFGSGTIFSFNPTSNVLTNLASFDGANGASPVASLTLDFNGVFYGTTYTGNNIDGTSVQDKNLKSWEGKGLIGVSRKPKKPS